MYSPQPVRSFSTAVFSPAKWFLAVLLFAGACCGLRAESVAVASGITCEWVGTYTVERLNTVLTTELAEFTDLSKIDVSYPEAKYAVKLYRVIYPSVIPELQNRPTLASGLIAVPQSGAVRMPVVSYQHGTVFSKSAVPSNPDESMETRLMLAQFAAQGYLVIAADYFGKGQSAEVDSYLVKGATQQACLDLYRAWQQVSEALGIEQTALFLSGWSQGGWATMAFLHKLETLGIEVTAAAPMAVPNDLYAAISGWIHKPRANDSFFLPALLMLQVNAYAEYYGLPGLDAVAFRPEYVATAKGLYLNTLSWEEAAPLLPPSVRALFSDAFINAGTPADSRYWQLMQDNAVYHWRSVTPLRAYYGQADEIVTPYIGSLGASYQTAAGGADAVAIDAGAQASHRGTFVYGVADQKLWFDALLTAGEEGR